MARGAVPLAMESSPAKRLRLPCLLVRAEKGGSGIQGLEVLLGRYEPSSRHHAGQPIYKKVADPTGHQAGGMPCFLYYWGIQDGEAQDGWWFGDEVGGAMVYCYAHAKGFPPPVVGWRIPAEDHPEIACLRVVPEGSSAITRAHEVGATASRPPRTIVSGIWVNPNAQRFYFGYLTHGASPALGIQLSSDLLPKVLAVAEGSPADQQGVPRGGVLKAINGKAIYSEDDKVRAMSELKSRPLVLEILPPEEVLPEDGSASPGMNGSGGDAGGGPTMTRTKSRLLPRRSAPAAPTPARLSSEAPSAGTWVAPSPSAASPTTRPQPPGMPPPAHLIRPAAATGAPTQRAAPSVMPTPQLPSHGGQAARPTTVKAGQETGPTRHVSVPVPEGAHRRAAVLISAFTAEEAQSLEYLLLKVLQERSNGGGHRPLWRNVLELAL